jgi:RecA/RadA recombinase
MSAEKLDQLMMATRKEHGPGSFRFASETRAAAVFRISTGVFTLDYALNGGIPIGRTTEIVGKRSSGKSSLLAKIVANAQRMCRKCYGQIVFEEKEVEVKVKKIDPATGRIIEVLESKLKHIPVDCISKCRVELSGEDAGEEDKKKLKKVFPGRMNVVWIDAEGTYDVPFYEKFGVDNDDVYLIITDYGEQAVDLADAAIRTGEVDLLILDTIVHLTPMKEREKSTEENAQPGLQAKLINRAMRMWTSSMNELEAGGNPDCTIILVNQLRQKIGLFPMDFKPGGEGQGYATSAEIRLWQKEFQFDGTGRTLWMNTEFAVEKNKCGPPKMAGKYRTCLLDHPDRRPGDTWDDEVVAEAADENGFILKKNGKWTVIDQTFDSGEAFKKEVSLRGDFYRMLRAKLLELLCGMPSDGKLAEKKKKDV